MPTTTYSHSQHPKVVARACRDLIVSDRASSAANTIARYVVGRYVGSFELDGAYLASGLHRWARTELRYVQEPHQEFVASLARTFVTKAGDCDDFVVAVGTVAAATGAGVLIGWRWTGPRLAHVYPIVSAGWSERAVASGPYLVCDPLEPQIRSYVPGECVEVLTVPAP